MKRAAALTLAALALAATPSARAEPYRLRGEAFAEAQSPAGLLALQADGDVGPWLSAEVLVWTGGTDSDVLVVVVRARDPEGRGDLRLGRFVQTTGALRPVHTDGLSGLARLPWWELRLEAFAGIPVEPRFAAQRFDWVVGTRASRAIGGSGSAGIAYLQRRHVGQLADEEIGIDAAGSPIESVDLSGRVAYDLVNPGVSEARAAAGARRGRLRGELYGLHRSPSRILPATSLFSVLGDVPAGELGGSIRWRAAPRLDLDALAAARRIGGEVGARLSARALLRLDDRGAGALSAELRREPAPDGGWTGVRGAARVPVRPGLTAAAEAELAIPDQHGGRGRVWPWALCALRWRPAAAWEAAAALEASSTPEHAYRLDALLRLARVWEAL